MSYEISDSLGKLEMAPLTDMEL